VGLEAKQGGSPGRPPGIPNKLTKTLKEAVVLACERHGEDGKGANGLVGYMFLLASEERKTMGALLGRMIPLEVSGAIEHSDAQDKTYTTTEELREQLRQRRPRPSLAT
jgi:hypothetical protein